MDDSIARNRAHWNADAERWVEAGRRRWATDEPFWGIWNLPESEIGLLPDVAGADVWRPGSFASVATWSSSATPTC